MVPTKAYGASRLRPSSQEEPLQSTDPASIGTLVAVGGGAIVLAILLGKLVR